MKICSTRKVKMSYSRNAAAGVCPLKLSERLDRVRLEVTESKSPPRSKPVQYKQMAIEMLDKSLKKNRVFQNDIFDLILICICQGNNIDRIIKQWPRNLSDKKRKNLITMKEIYNLKGNIPHYDCSPTLSRIAAAFPQVTISLTELVKANPDGPQLNEWVKDGELGAAVPHHFKMIYFPGLIDLDGFCFKAEVGLLLFNLCHAKSIANSSSPRMNIVIAFRTSCQISAGIIEERMAPPRSKQEFTKFIKSFDFQPQMLFNVWNAVIGENYIPTDSITLRSYFHEKVLLAQPLDEYKWRELMDSENREN